MLKYCFIKDLKKNLATGFTDFTEVKEKITTDPPEADKLHGFSPAATRCDATVVIAASVGRWHGGQIFYFSRLCYVNFKELEAQTNTA